MPIIKFSRILVLISMLSQLEMGCTAKAPCICRTTLVASVDIGRLLDRTIVDDSEGGAWVLATIDPIRKPKLRDLTWPDLDPSTGIQIPRKSALILAQQSITIHKVITGIVTEKMWINECSFKGMTMNGHVRTVCESLMEGGTAFLHLSRRPGVVDKSRIDRAIFIARMKSGTETSVSEELIENEVRP